MTLGIKRTYHQLWQGLILTAAAAVGLASSASWAAPTYRTEKLALVPPVSAACVSSPFGPRVLPNRPLAGTFHNGIDLPAPIGSPVTAVGPGIVLRVQNHGIGGLELLIQHNGFIGVYSHLGLIAPELANGGRTIYGGEKIATVGLTGLTFGPHLYFGMIMDGQSVDPAPRLHVVACGTRAVVKNDPRLLPTRVFAQH